jgi:hypothetical protein
MSIELKVYDNGDHTCLVWLPEDEQPIANCRGFSIRRLLNGQESYLHGFVGFDDNDKLDPAAPWKFPLQRYMWWDYLLKPGDKVQYSVLPVIGSNKEHLVLDTKNSSPPSPEMKIAGQRTPHISAYFNKGIVAAQWVSRALDAAPKNSKITDLVTEAGNPLRNALSGLLRPAIFSLLSETRRNKGKIFAALYELNDRELIDALAAFGRDCHLILANGAFKSNQPGKNDENEGVRAELKSKVSLFDRIVKTGHFAHNKFVVFCDAHGTPHRVLTGSTNWTFTGLCTQANNAIVVDDPDVAADYLEAWQRIKAAGNDYPQSFVRGNSSAKTHQVDDCRITPWFVKTSAGQDLEYARKLINSAKEGILFLFFNPGSFQEDPTRWTLLQNILERHNQANPNTYSLSKLQFYAWTVAAIFGYLVLTLAQSLVQGKFVFADIPKNLPGIIFISAGTTAVAQGITAIRGAKGAGPIQPSLGDFVTTGGLVAAERFQFFIWTLVGVCTFLFLVVFSDPASISDLPAIPEGFLALMGVSCFGYLGGKLARKPGPIIDDITASPGGLTLKINGRKLSTRAGFNIDGSDVSSNMVNVSGSDPDGAPADELFKTLTLVITEPAARWQLTGRHDFTISNPDGQTAQWFYRRGIQSANSSEHAQAA